MTYYEKCGPEGMGRSDKSAPPRWTLAAIYARNDDDNNERNASCTGGIIQINQAYDTFCNIQ